MITDKVLWECDRCTLERLTDSDAPEGWQRWQQTVVGGTLQLRTLHLCDGCAQALTSWLSPLAVMREMRERVVSFDIPDPDGHEAAALTAEYEAERG